MIVYPNQCGGEACRVDARNGAGHDGGRSHAETTVPLVVENPRFLILPWIKIPNLGSHILAIIRHRLPRTGPGATTAPPVLIETFAQAPRCTSAVYRASGWIHVGTMQGGARYDREKLDDRPRKDVWLRPLRRDWQRILNR